jgi:hypothetical protein
MKKPCVYIMANRQNGTLYKGVTSNLPRRVYERREGLVAGSGVPGLLRRYAPRNDGIRRKNLENPWMTRRAQNSRSEIPFFSMAHHCACQNFSKFFQNFLWPFWAISMGYGAKNLEMRFQRTCSRLRRTFTLL